MSELKLNTRVRDTNFYKKANAPLVQSVSKDLFKVNWDLNIKKYPRMLIHPADFTGCGYYRLIFPMQTMMEKNQIQALATNRIFKTHEVAKYDPDTIIFQRQCIDEQIKYIERCSKINQAFCIYELDDLLDGIQPKNVHYKDFNQKHFDNLYKALRLCDRFVCSTEFIKEWYSKYIKDIVVMPNRLRRDIWSQLEMKKIESAKIRVGWSGGYSHTGDLEVIIDTVKEMYKEVDFIFMGYVHPEIEKYIREFRAGVKFLDYPKALSQMAIDIALIPLEDVPFNHAKSHLKVIEFGALGTPVIASNLTPYKNFPITHAKTNDSKGFTDALKELLSDMEETRKMGQTLKDYVYNNYMLDDYIDEWQKAWTPN